MAFQHLPLLTGARNPCRPTDLRQAAGFFHSLGQHTRICHLLDYTIALRYAHTVYGRNGKINFPMSTANELIVIGGGLAGSEAAWQAAERGLKVKLYEMRPVVATGAHQTESLAELVCSNSLGSNLPDRASGVLKAELRHLGSLLLEVAEETALPAGAALAVDRERFAARVTERVSAHPNIRLVREECPEIP